MIIRCRDVDHASLHQDPGCDDHHLDQHHNRTSRHRVPISDEIICISRNGSRVTLLSAPQIVQDGSGRQRECFSTQTALMNRRTLVVPLRRRVERWAVRRAAAHPPLAGKQPQEMKDNLK